MLFELTANQILGVRRIWSNGRLVWSAADDADSATLLASTEAAEWESIQVFTGAADQLPWAVYEAAVGVGNAPAMRGRGCVGITGVNLGGSGYLPQFTFEVVSAGDVAPGDRVQLWQHVATMVPSDTNNSVGSVGWAGRDRNVPVLTMSRYSFRNGTDTADLRIRGTEDEAALAARDYLNANFTGQVTPPSALVGSWALSTRVETVTGPPGGTSDLTLTYTATFLSTVDFVTTYTVTQPILVRYKLPPAVVFTNPTGSYALADDAVPLAGDGGVRFGRVFSGSSDESVVIAIDGENGTGVGGAPDEPRARAKFSSSPADGVLLTGAPFGSYGADWCYTARGDFLWAMIKDFGPRSCYRWAKTGGAPIVTSADLGDYADSMCTDGATLWIYLRATGIKGYNATTLVHDGLPVISFPAGVGSFPSIHCDDLGNLQTFGDGKVYRRNFGLGTWEEMLDIGSEAASGIPYTSARFHPPVFVRGGLFVQTTEQTTPVVTNTAYGNLELLAANPVPLSDVVLDLCTRSGLEESYVDVTDLETTFVRALAVSQVTPARQVIEMLMAAYFFSATESATLRFVLRGGPAVATLGFDDLGAGENQAQEDRLPITRRSDIEIPAQVAITYSAADADYQQATEYSDRLIGRATGAATAQFPLALLPQEAKRIADAQLLDGATAATGIGPVGLTVAWSALEPTDVLLLADELGNTFRVRVERVNDAGGVRTVELLLDDASVLSSAALTDDGYTATSVVRLLLGTSLELLDVPILRDVDDDPGYYAAFTPAGSDGTWPGAALLRGLADTGYEEVARAIDRTVMGTCTTTLGTFSGGTVFDQVNTVTVAVDGTLASHTRAAVLNGTAPAMLIGEEVLQYTTATLVSAGVYTLSGLLRGRRGTEWAIAGHAADERAVLLQASGLRRVAMDAGQLGAQYSHKAVTFGRPVAAAEVEEFTNTGAGLKPFAPVDLRISRNLATADILLSWKRRTRLAPRFTGAAGISVPLGEVAEAYEVEIWTDDFLTLQRTVATTTPALTYTTADQEADFGSAPADIGLRIYQLSATVGRGTALELAVPVPAVPAYRARLTLGGAFEEGIGIVVLANGATIGSHTPVSGDVDLDGVATALAAAIDGGPSAYGATAAGEVVDITGPSVTPYTVVATVTGDSGLGIGLTQTAAPAGPGTAYEANLFITEITGATEPIPSGVTFTVTVQQPAGTTLGTFSYTTTYTTTKLTVLSGLAAALAANGTLTGLGFSMGVDSGVGGYFGTFDGPVGESGVFLSTSAGSGFGLSVSITAPGSDPVVSDRPQIIDIFIGGTPVAGEVFTVTLGGVDYTYTAGSADTDDDVAAGLASVIDAAAAYIASATGAQATVTGATANVPFTYTGSVTRAITVAVSYP